MEYQKVTNLLDNTPNQPSKFMTKNWAETNYGSYGTYNTGSQIKFKTLMLRSSLCENRDMYILAQGTIAVKNIGTAAASGGCNPVNWLSQTRGNLTIEYMNLNFVTTPKLTPLHSFFFLAFGSFPFRECVHFQAFSIPIFCSISLWI